MIDVLKVLANSLTTLELTENVVCELSFYNVDDAVEMPKLKSLILYTGPLKFLQLLMKCRITDLYIDIEHRFYSRTNIQYFVNFLSVQVDLKVNCIMHTLL